MILPGSTIGIFGSGQLGRMFAIEARKMGYRVHTFSPDTDTPTGQVADIETTADYNDLDEVRKFVQKVDVVTFEFENVPAETIRVAEEFVEVHPKGDVLHTTQNRLREKNFLKKHGFPHARFRHIQTLEDLNQAVEELGLPCVLKTAGFGYDGKGQTKITSPEQTKQAYTNLAGQEGILEAFVDFAKEVSVVCARNKKGEFVHYGVIENSHHNHILDISFAPAKVSDKVRREAIEITHQIADVFGYVGTLCVEFFLTKKDELLVNEIAPRPHNSGHLTFDACITSQFEQQLRAVCDLPLGSTEFYKPAAMANLLGDIWQFGEPSWSKALETPNVKLHIYGKSEARRGRKMGHITALADSTEEAVELVTTARRKLTENASAILVR
ncbi:MAG: 5-(carboxyamino)imidazole ribonucleotide synthase [Acidobacteria bacterium]|jgi:5-(carboxyamino)imidazole ribonucleotide synthase|nr:MAG: 5-(carboxyamino)imidazole ribonucleotide synthase [Acidobacteriota bacterium]GIU81285.1 MAG: N5-carboxyaminoimidazole ribonucleotide synthase [Pyrinomonadaceae bacterium]